MEFANTFLMFSNARLADKNADIADWNGRIAERNAQIAESNADAADAAMALAKENAEIAARQFAIKNAALKELARLDPNNKLLKQSMRNAVGDEGIEFYRSTGQFPPLPLEVKNIAQ